MPWKPHGIFFVCQVWRPLYICDKTSKSMREDMFKPVLDAQLEAVRYFYSPKFVNLQNKADVLRLLSGLPTIEYETFSGWSMEVKSGSVFPDRLFRGNFKCCLFEGCHFTNVAFTGVFYKCVFRNCTFLNCTFGGHHPENQASDFVSSQFYDCTLSECGAIQTNFNYSDWSLTKVEFESFNVCGMRGASLRESTLVIYHARGSDFFMSSSVASNISIDDHLDCGLELVCPESGEFTAYKRVDCCNTEDAYGRYTSAVAKLVIPASAKRSSAFSRKCRASEALVVGFYDLDGYPLSDAFINMHEFHSTHRYGFKYKLGEKVVPDSFDPDRWKECASGIHFFMTFKEAANY